jgi:hypothetical protein
MIKKILLSVFTLCLTLLCLTTAAYASDKGGEILTVNAAWVDGDMMRVNVTDANGVESALALRLKDYVDDAENDEFISVQAVDLKGNTSGVIQLKNPFYVPPSEAEPEPDGTSETVQLPAVIVQTSESAVPDADEPENGSEPFTPQGAGNVVDNARDSDGKEFFTIDTEDGNVFYLIVDRQRNADNVYLLNAVTENDLAALAEKDGNTAGGASAIPTPEPEPTPEPAETPAPEPEPTASGKNSGTIIFILIAVVVAGVAGYYFKIVKGKNRASVTEDDEDDYDYEDEDDTEEAEDGGDEEYGAYDAEREVEDE